MNSIYRILVKKEKKEEGDDHHSPPLPQPSTVPNTERPIECAKLDMKSLFDLSTEARSVVKNGAGRWGRTW